MVYDKKDFITYSVKAEKLYFTLMQPHFIKKKWGKKRILKQSHTFVVRLEPHRGFVILIRKAL